MTSKRVALIQSPALISLTNLLPRVQGRASRVASLIQSCGLGQHLDVIGPLQATFEDLSNFHSQNYIDFLIKLSKSDDIEQLELEAEEFGLEYDCQLMPNLSEICLSLAGSSLKAADALASLRYDVALNWHGGWHHAQRDQAEGFCYINDVVLCITQLRKTFDKVLYIDLDVHHGNGVENAFAFSKKVFTLSLHLYEAGFYPGTGNIGDIGLGKGRFHSLNVPLKEGIGDKRFSQLFRSSFEGIVQIFKPDAIVCQCGSDSLNGDPLGGFNLTIKGILSCIGEILTAKVPVIFLGGGGYVRQNAAKLWTSITSLCCGHLTKENILQRDIPDSDFYFMEYGPSFEFQIDCGRRKDENSEEHVHFLEKSIKGHLDHLQLQTE